MALAAVQAHFTPGEYLALERNAEFKSEYIDGEIIAMSGASREHNLVGGNIFAFLHAQLRGRSCEVYFNDMRLGVDLARHYTYPDVAVVCGEPEFADDQFDTLLNPTVLVEVLSPSTEDYDRGRKFARYRALGTLVDYVLVAQDQMHVEHFTRDGMRWTLTELGEPDAVLDLPSIGCHLTLAEIYERVKLNPEADLPSADGPSPLPR
jgi:Uma2 family endonuclease